MMNLIIQVSKYLIILLMALYTLQCFTVFRLRDEEAKSYLFLRQNMLMFSMHFVAFMVLYLELAEATILLFYGAQVLYLAAMLVLFGNLYRRASRLLINNMCMLISIGFIMITRLSYEQSVKQFKIAAISSVVALLIPVIIRKLRLITRMYWAYTLLGIGLLALVAIAARSTYGAKISFEVAGISVQPSEFVKIIYVFAIAGLLAHARDFRRIVIATGLAAVHVLILVVSKDLGSALIFFLTYLVMLFVSTKNPFYVLAGVLSGSVAAVGAYFVFGHVRVRVQAWRDPFRDYQGDGYQIGQSLFAISAGSWFGTGLCQGSPSAIPLAAQDMMFAAICEELGSIFGICLILVCMSCFVMFVNISMQLTNRYYRLVAVGLGTTYAVQTFLTVGGAIKLIPLTGVTLPLVSYGGSSMLSTLIMFAIVQGLYMLQRDEESRAEKQRLAEAGYEDESGRPRRPYFGKRTGNPQRPFRAGRAQDPYYDGGAMGPQDPYYGGDGGAGPQDPYYGGDGGAGSQDPYYGGDGGVGPRGPYYGGGDYPGVQEDDYEDYGYVGPQEEDYGQEEGYYGRNGYVGPRYDYYADDGDPEEPPYREEEYGEGPRRR